ncbi:MAG: OmpA family protein, partial [Pseudomonadota bacterium]
MRLSSYVTVGAAFLFAAVLCFVGAGFAVSLIEDNSRDGVKAALEKQGMTWADADANGLQLFVIGTAPSEAERFKAVTTAGTVVDAARVIDQMEVAEREAFAPPRFSVEILRNDSGISLIGLVPDSEESKTLRDDIADLAASGRVSDLLESASYPPPAGWEQSLDLGLRALRRLPRSKISIDAGSVYVTAMVESREEKFRVEEDLRKQTPKDVRLVLDLSAPRPVITPFTLRFLIDEQGPRFDACTADTEEARDTILEAARNAGLQDEGASCDIGLGVPSRQWSEAASLAITKLSELNGGSVTFSDADIALIALEGTDQATFDRIVGELETGLPEVFALKSVLPVPVDTSQGPPEFTATLSPEGQVQLRGRVASELARETADSFAKARFGSDTVYTAARLDDTLPRDWSVRVLAGIEALSLLANGSVTVTPDRVRIFGETGNPNANAKIARLMADKLRAHDEFAIEVTYREKLDPVAGLPTPEECVEQIAQIQSSRKITFEPGSETLDASAESILNDIAEILQACGNELRLEISGHTDSQGREVMNQQLSQARAQSVLNALRERRVLTSSFLVKGYGEENPIADNGTEDGREANRRIEFKLIVPEETPEEQTTLEAL